MEFRKSQIAFGGSLSFGLRVLGLASIAATMLFAAGMQSALAQNTESVAPTSLLVYVDTDTLALNLNPGTGLAPLELSIDMLKALNTSDKGLKPVTNNGLTILDLEGRFQSVWVAVTDSDGKVHPFCITGLPASVQLAAQTVLNSQGVR